MPGVGPPASPGRRSATIRRHGGRDVPSRVIGDRCRGPPWPRSGLRRPGRRFALFASQPRCGSLGGACMAKRRPSRLTGQNARQRAASGRVQPRGHHRASETPTGGHHSSRTDDANTLLWDLSARAATVNKLIKDLPPPWRQAAEIIADERFGLLAPLYVARAFCDWALTEHERQLVEALQQKESFGGSRSIGRL
jgi:hypothetical protein